MIRKKYDINKMEAIINNYFNNKDCESAAEFVEMQVYRQEVKDFCKVVFET